ncbi:hypothetical protein ACHAXH_003897 [Discostella pseudostelligera]
MSSMTKFLLIAIVFASISSSSDAFSTRRPLTTTTSTIITKAKATASAQLLQSRLSLPPLLATSSSSNVDVVVVISPPGGIGEMTSIEAARLGGSVKWFVVSPPSTTTTTTTAAASASSESSSVKQVVSLTSDTLTAIQSSGGSLELAGASADSLLQQQIPDNNNGRSTSSSSNSALTAMAAWCANSKCIISTYDNGSSMNNKDNEIMMEETMIRAAIRLATKEAVGNMQPTTASTTSNGGSKKNVIAILPTGVEEVVESMASSDNNNNKGEASGGGGLFGIDLFGGKKDEPLVPTTLMNAGGSIVIRYGELFGAPESSPESSPFMGGPKRDPIVRDMYTQRSVRVDPTIFSSTSSSSSSSSGGGMTFKSNRLAVAEAVSRLGMGKIESIGKDDTRTTTLDVSLSSFAGTEKPTDDEWNAEFGRVVTEMKMSPSSSSVSGGGVTQQQPRRLFRAEFASVPSTKRLAEWIATKWAPAVLRSYDIAGIRVGARPVYALLQSSSSSSSSSTVTNVDGKEDVYAVEIVWQELVNFNSVTSGKMIIEVGESGMMAWRGAGDASKGFGSISASPLPGEDILVRRLADAASQAIEKGLAAKPQSAKKAEVVISKKPVTTVVVDSVDDTALSPPPPPTPSSEPADVESSSSFSNDGPGPRSAGARRSSERSRGTRKGASTSSSTPPNQIDGEES